VMKRKAASNDPAAVRSANMARIRSANTRPELKLRSALWREGLRYRLGLRVVGTRPDLVFPSCKVVVFVDGCFWHGCSDHYVRPRSRSEFWAAKLAANITRDRRQTQKLLEAGWTVLRLWEHEIKADIAQVVGKVLAMCNASRTDFNQRMVVTKVEEYNREGSLERWYIEDLLDPTQAFIEIRRRDYVRPQVRKSSRIVADKSA
jgi:DNA mismatch endonuclease (patch repair protein)